MRFIPLTEKKYATLLKGQQVMKKAKKPHKLPR